jgi:hypothetical protein
LRLIAELRPPPDPALREVFGHHAFEPKSRERCVLIRINSTISGTL